MDYFNFLLSMVLIFLSFQYGQNWIIFAILILSVLTIKSFKAVLALILGTLALYLLIDNGNFGSSFPLIVIGIAIVALVLGVGKGGEEPPAGGMGQSYADLLGGMGGGGGEYA